MLLPLRKVIDVVSLAFTYKCLQVYYQISFYLSMLFLQLLILYVMISASKKEEVYYMATVSLTIRIDENDKKVIEELAKKDDRSISYIVNQSIKEFIKKSSTNGQTLEKAK